MAKPDLIDGHESTDELERFDPALPGMNQKFAASDQLKN